MLVTNEYLNPLACPLCSCRIGTQTIDLSRCQLMCSLNEMCNWRPSECSSACRALWALPSSGAAADPAALLGNAVGQQMSFSYSPARRNASCQTIFLHYALKLDNKQDLISVTENPEQVLAVLQPFLQRLAVTDMQQLHRAGSCAFCGLLPLESHVLDEARDKHHYLKICGCFTYTVYSPTLPPGWVWWFFTFWNIYIFSLVLCIEG